MDKETRDIAERYASECKTDGLDLLRTLGTIPAPTRQEDKRAAFVRDWFMTQGAGDVSIDDAKNVICKIGPMDGDLVVFAAHTDVVFPDTTPFTIVEEDGRMCAPGIGDDTANLVNLMMATRYVLKNNLLPAGCGILVVANACEEGLGNLDGVKHLFATYGDQIKKFHSFDGYTPQCTSTAVGSYRYRLDCKTHGGHSYLNFGEPNAIEILCRLVEELYRINAPTEVKTTYNVGRIEGGTTVNSLPQSAFMLYEFRSTSQKCLSLMEGRFLAAVEKIRMSLSGGKPEPGEITVELLGVRPGNGETDKDALACFTANNAEIIGNFYEGPMDYAAYSTDSNIPLSAGILANTIGTVRGGGAHTREEWVQVDSLVSGLKIVLSIMLQFFR